MALRTVFAASVLGLAAAQAPGAVPDNHPPLTTWKCTTAGGCVQRKSYLVFDSLSHWIHQKNDTNLSCGAWGVAPNKTVCPSTAVCQQNCVMEGISDYSAFGVSTNNATLDIQYLRADGGVNSPKLYLLGETKQEYELLQLAGKEFTFDVDVSRLPCGMNGALYMSEMAANGGRSILNTGGAAFGTGGCDTQCSVTPFINGVGNIDAKGACCAQFDVWKANSRSTLMAPYTCNIPRQYLCTGAECNAGGVCDKNGCGMNPYAIGDAGFYGPGYQYQIDTTRPFTVVTQFPLDRNGVMKEIHRFFLQDGQKVQNAAVLKPGFPEMDFINDDYCTKAGASQYMTFGGNTRMGEALARGMVLTFTMYWDEYGFMNWLDSGSAGPCNATEGDPKVIRKVQNNVGASFSNIKWGEIGSTFVAPPEDPNLRKMKREMFAAMNPAA